MLLAQFGFQAEKVLCNFDLFFLFQPSWVEYFTSLALGVSMRSKDPKTQVGCVIVDSKTLKVRFQIFEAITVSNLKKWSREQQINR